MTPETITPQACRQLLEQGALLVDIRAADEYAREHIPGARHIALETLERAAPIAGDDVVIFHCRSGNRTQMNAARLAGCVPGQARILEGGLDAWKQAGFPVQKDAGQPLEMQRQVQIAAGSMVLLGTLLSVFVSPWFLLLTGFVGCGLMFAGISGFCGLARVLMKAPWNAPSATSCSTAGRMP